MSECVSKDVAQLKKKKRNWDKVQLCLERASYYVLLCCVLPDYRCAFILLWVCFTKQLPSSDK